MTPSISDLTVPDPSLSDPSSSDSSSSASATPHAELTHFHIAPIAPELAEQGTNTEQGPSSGSTPPTNPPTDAATTRNTSVEAEIPRNLPQVPVMAGIFTPAQRQEMAAIIGEALAISRQQLEGNDPNDPNNPGDPNGDGNARRAIPVPAKPVHFNPKLVGYFDPNPDKPPVEAKDGTNTYHNVFSFTARLRVKETSMDKLYLTQNLDACLLDKADSWYTTELSAASRLGMRLDPAGVATWCTMLEERFRDAPGKSLAALEAVRYTVADARLRKDPAEYMTTIVINGKNSGIAVTEASQVLLAYEHIDGQLRRDLARPTPTSTVSSMIEELRLIKDVWFDIYGNWSSSKSSMNNNTRQTRSDRTSGQYGGQFQSNRAGYQAFRPGNQSYARPFYPTNQAYQSNQQQPNQRQNAPQLPPTTQRLQITAGPSNASDSRQAQPPRSNNSNNQGNQGNQGNR